MKAYVQTGVGDKEGNAHGDLGVLKLKDTEKPTDLKSGQVLLKVYAAALNPVDLKRTLMHFDGQESEVVAGYDAAGIVEAVGSGVTEFSKGDRVFGDIVSDTLGPKTTGSLAEFAVAPACTLAKIPDRVSFTDAAALPLVSLTAIQVLRFADAKEGHKLFVTAGSGGVGLHLMQIAKASFGISEIATTASRLSEELLTKYGADIVIDYTTQDAGQVLKGWADIVFDTMAQVEMEKSIVKEGGKLMSIVFVKDEAFENVLVQPSKKDMQSIAHLLEEGKLVPIIDSVYAFEDVEKAMQHEMSGHSKGKVVVKMAHDDD